MKGFIVLTLEDDGVKLSAIEGLTVVEVFNMIQGASQHFATIIGSLAELQAKENATAGEGQPSDEPGGEDSDKGEGPKAPEVEP